MLMQPHIPDIILASASKTRKAMLENAGITIKTQAANVDEHAIKASLLAENAPPQDIADCLADAKARAVALLHTDAIVIGSDQLLVVDGKIVSKASTRAEAVSTLQKLSGKSHQLMSAAVLYEAGQPVWRCVEGATLMVRPLSTDFINRYLDTLGDDAFWSVGCYQLEGLGAQLFTHINGDYFTILGMPLLPLLDYLRRSGCIAL